MPCTEPSNPKNIVMGKSETSCTKIKNGRYRIKREFDLDGYIEEEQIECNNPAYGAYKLDEWQIALLEAKRPPARETA